MLDVFEEFKWQYKAPMNFKHVEMHILFGLGKKDMIF